MDFRSVFSSPHNRHSTSSYVHRTLPANVWTVPFFLSAMRTIAAVRRRKSKREREGASTWAGIAARNEEGRRENLWKREERTSRRERRERGKKSRGKGGGRKEAARFAAAAAAERNGGDSSIEVSVSVGRRSSDPGSGGPAAAAAIGNKNRGIPSSPPFNGGRRSRALRFARTPLPTACLTFYARRHVSDLPTVKQKYWISKFKCLYVPCLSIFKRKRALTSRP